MMKFNIRKFGICLVLLFAAQVQSAFADTLRLRIEDVLNNVGVVITDNGPSSLDEEPTSGVVKFTGGPLGSFMFNFTVGASSTTATGDGSDLYILTGNLESTSFGWLRITIEDLNLTPGPNGQSILTSTSRSEFESIDGTLPGPTGSFGFVQSWVSPDNLVPDLGPDAAGVLTPWTFTVPAGSVQAFGDPGSVFGIDPLPNTSSAGFTKTGSYALFTQINAAFSGPGVLVLDDNVTTAPAPRTAVPEPGSLVLLASGLTLLLLKRRP
jgi:hypothetical protein